MDRVLEQIELEKQMTQQSVNKYRNEFNKNQQGNLSNTQSGNIIISSVVSKFSDNIKTYLDTYSAGKAVRCTIAATVINRLGADVTAYIATKVIFNMMNNSAIQAIYKAIGQALEDEHRMINFHKENKAYYESIQKDLNSRGAKANRKKYITQEMFDKRLDFHCDKWSTTEKIQTGMLLVKMFAEATNLVTLRNYYKGKKTVKELIPTPELVKLIDDLNSKLEVMSPFFLPMVCEPKPWTDIFEGGYLSPYLRKNKVIKNNDKEYLNRLRDSGIGKALEALNTIQNTPWQINREVLDVVKLLWEVGTEAAGLPSRDDTPIQPYPFPDSTKDTQFTPTEKELIKKWKRETYETHKANVANRSIRILTSQILRVADQFKDYEAIWFPYQMDFRGRMYPIPVLLQPQGSDLAKGLLRFAEGKSLDTKEAKEWFFIHGANVFGYDKANYKDRVEWVKEHSPMILNCARHPLEYREWMEADKPFQFLAWCFEYRDYCFCPDFKSHIPIQLDGTCNGLQHYSALLRDEIAGEAVNLINTPVPSDIYQKVADRLIQKLKDITNEQNRSNNTICNDSPDGNNRNIELSNRWLSLGINRKLTKRPVMVLPYGGTRLSCRAYIMEYLKENYSSQFIWEHFQTGKTPQDCMYKVSLWLSEYLWQAIQETLKSAVIGMAYLKSVAKVTLNYQNSIEWYTPMGLMVHQAYTTSKIHQIKTELFGKLVKTRYRKFEEDKIDKQKQLNGICPNFIHSLDAACLMKYLLKCKEQGLTSFMSVHDCYGVHAADTELSAKLLREAFVEIYQRPILDDFEADLTDHLPEDIELPEKPEQGKLKIEDVLTSEYFFN